MKSVISMLSCGVATGVILLSAGETLAQTMYTASKPLGAETSIVSSPRLSEKTATRLSAFGTVIPTGLGFILAATRSGHEYYYNDMYGYPYSYHDDPDQTVPALLISSGIILGPSLGYFYAGRPGRAFAGIGFRTAIGFGALIGAFATCGWDCGEGEEAYDTAWGILIIGGALVAGSAIYDIGKVDNAVRAQNLKHAGPKISVLPDYFPGHKTLGLRAKLTF
jgi:hypothetical protein